MEQRDYLIRKIEKIGTVLLAMIGQLKRIDNFQQFEQEKEMIDSRSRTYSFERQLKLEQIRKKL